MESTSLTNAHHPIFGSKPLFYEVLKNFNVFDLFQTIARVCKEWKEVSRDTKLLKQIDMPLWICKKLNPTPKIATIPLGMDSIYALYKDRIIVGDEQRTLKIFKKSGELLSAKKEAHLEKIFALKVAKDKCLSVSSSALKVWDLESQALDEPHVFSPNEKEGEKVDRVVFNGRHIVANVQYLTETGSSKLRMRIWDTKTTFCQSLDFIFNKFTFTEKFGFFIDIHKLKVLAYDLEKNALVLDQKLETLTEKSCYQRIYQNKLCVLRREDESAHQSKMQLYSLPELKAEEENKLPKIAPWQMHKHYLIAKEKTECTLLSFKENWESQITKMVDLPDGYKIKMDGTNTLLFFARIVFAVHSSIVNSNLKGIMPLTDLCFDPKRVKILDGIFYLRKENTLIILNYKEKGLMKL